MGVSTSHEEESLHRAATVHTGMQRLRHARRTPRARLEDAIDRRVELMIGEVAHRLHRDRKEQVEHLYLRVSGAQEGACCLSRWTPACHNEMANEAGERSQLFVGNWRAIANRVGHGAQYARLRIPDSR